LGDDLPERTAIRGIDEFETCSTLTPDCLPASETFSQYTRKVQRINRGNAQAVFSHRKNSLSKSIRGVDFPQ
jgi:hypothetical protein